MWIFISGLFWRGSGIELCGCVSGRFRTSASGIAADVIFRKILKKGVFFSTIKRKGKRIERFERRKDESENSTCCISGI